MAVSSVNGGNQYLGLKMILVNDIVTILNYHAGFVCKFALRDREANRVAREIARFALSLLMVLFLIRR